MRRDRIESPDHVPTSAHLLTILDRAERGRVTVGWLAEELGERSFGLTLFVMAVLALMPGGSLLVGVLIAWPAIQMLLGHEVAVLPRLVTRRKIAVARLARVVRLLAPGLQWIERLIRPRWPTPFEATKRVVGLVTLLVGLTLLSPVPFSHILPALVIMLVALAYLEGDGIALLVALIAALSSLAITATTLWGAVKTVDWLDPVVQG